MTLPLINNDTYSPVLLQRTCAGHVAQEALYVIFDQVTPLSSDVYKLLEPTSELNVVGMLPQAVI